MNIIKKEKLLLALSGFFFLFSDIKATNYLDLFPHSYGSKSLKSTSINFARSSPKITKQYLATSIPSNKEELPFTLYQSIPPRKPSIPNFPKNNDDDLIESDFTAPSSPLPAPVKNKNLEQSFELPTVIPQADLSKVEILKINFLGNTLFSDAALQKVVQPYLNRPIDVIHDLEALRVAVTKYYINNGYINSGALIKSFENNILVLTIIEGRLTGTHIKGLDGLRESYVMDRLWPDKNQPLNIKSLQENFQVLLQDPLFKKIQSRVQPATKRGEAILDLTIERNRPWSIYAGVNNYRSTSSGENQWVIGGHVRNLTGFGDRLDVFTNSSLKSKATNGYGFSFHMPISSYKTSMTLGYNKSKASIIEKNFEKYSNANNSMNITLSHPFIDTLIHSFSMDLSYYNRKNQNYFDNQPYGIVQGEIDTKGKTENKVYRLSANYSFRQPKYAFASRLTYSSGKHNHTITNAFLANITKAADSPYKIFLLQALFNYKLTEGGIVLSFRSNWQNTSNYLLGMERYAVTSSQGVRGYLENQGTYDKANTNNIELHIPIMNSSNGLNLTFIPFYDVGSGSYNFFPSDTTQNNKVFNFSSIGASLTANYLGFSMNITYAKPKTSSSVTVKNNDSYQAKGLQYSLRYDY